MKLKHPTPKAARAGLLLTEAIMLSQRVSDLLKDDDPPERLVRITFVILKAHRRQKRRYQNVLDLIMEAQ